MKKMFLSLLCFVFAIPAAVSAHAPSDAEFKYIEGKKMLIITIEHKVRNEKSHYINDIKIRLNGKEVITQKASVQTDKEVQKIAYVIPDIKEGDEVELSAECSIMGRKNFTYNVKTVEKKTEKKEEKKPGR
ncbi:MAG TPA: hypothetical protein ENN55_04670 [Firmicutes bacterium]|nr:hypothetical protein [Bacillota bacterium]